MKKIFILYCLIISVTAITAQSSGDSILSHERKIDRPLSLHQGQLQIKTAYDISIMSKEFDPDGNKLDLALNGKASVLHRYMLEINYGIFDFLQATAAINYSKRGERKENLYIFVSDTEPYYDISFFDDYRGFEDLFLGTVIRLPLKTKKFEFALAPGIFLPLFSNHPAEPEHSISTATAEQAFHKIVYHNHHKTCNGALAFRLGAMSIFRPGNNFSIFARFNYEAPLAEGETIHWIHQLNGNTFEYMDVPYKYLISNRLDYEIQLGYQAISWFNVSLAYIGQKRSAGWSEITGMRVGNPETSLSLASIGYEIKITGKLWISQYACIPVSGKNQLAPLSIYTGLSYNLFPFRGNQTILFNEDF